MFSSGVERPDTGPGTLPPDPPHLSPGCVHVNALAACAHLGLGVEFNLNWAIFDFASSGESSLVYCNYLYVRCIL